MVMKYYLILAIAALIIGFACFAIMFWGFRISYKTSFDTGLILAFTGFVVELLRPWIEKITSKKKAN